MKPNNALNMFICCFTIAKTIAVIHRHNIAWFLRVIVSFIKNKRRKKGQR